MDFLKTFGQSIFDIIESCIHFQTFVLSEFPVPILVEAIQLMSLGDKWNLTIPPELSNGSGEAVIFEVELLGIN